MTMESLFSELQNAQTEVSGLKSLIAKKDERIVHYESEVERLQEIIRGLQRQAFGTKSERWISQDQGELLFNEAEAEAAKPQDDGAEESAEGDGVKVGGHTRKRGKRKPLPENLPRKVVTVELPESERVDEDGVPLKVIGREISEKLVYTPAAMEVIEYHRLRYGRDVGDPVKTAPPVPAIIPKGIATPSLLSGIVVHKYSDGLPLYRLEDVFTRSGVELSRGSMARWMIRTGEACQPIWNVLEDRFFASGYGSCDETHTQVLKEKGRLAESRSWMWVRATPADDKKVVLFDYDPHRSGDVAKRLLESFEGFLQVDGYGAYNWTVKTGKIIRLGCNMHGRRGFEDALKNGAKHGQSLAEQGMRYYRRLYDLEEIPKKKGMSWEERFEYRQKQEVPLWEEMKSWAEENSPKVPPSSKIGEAFGYFLREYGYLRAYLQHGKLEPDNGFIERMIRKFGLGRNAWLFSDTVEGAKASAVLYSLVITAKVNAVNPYLALTKIFELLPAARTADDYERLANLLLSPDATV